MNLMTITAKNSTSKKYSVSVDLFALERIAGSLGLFQPKFMKDLGESVREMKARKFVKGKSLKDFR
jgi:hypothetical protein